uniref:DMT family transporter n=1 Tax=candidate division WOR-3 bacterium TaxID=2052148 RepID=A0A7C4YCI9_UNCW3
MNWFISGIITALTWGIAGIFSRGSLKSIPHNLSLIIFGISILFFYSIAWFIFGTPFPKGNYIIPFISEFAATLGYIFFYIALSKKGASSIVPITSSYIVISILIGKFILKNDITEKQTIAVILIVLGIIILSFKEFRFEKGNYVIFAVIATILWGIWGGLSDISVRIVKPVNLNLFFSLIGIFVWGIYFIFTRKSMHFNFPKNVLFLSVLSAFFSALGSILFYFSVLKSNVTLAIPVANMYPLFTIIIGILFLKEKVHKRQIIAFPLILTGLLLIG